MTRWGCCDDDDMTDVSTMAYDNVIFSMFRCAYVCTHVAVVVFHMYVCLYVCSYQYVGRWSCVNLMSAAPTSSSSSSSP